MEFKNSNELFRKTRNSVLGLFPFRPFPHVDYEDPWNGEDQLSGDSMPEALWSDV